MSDGPGCTFATTSELSVLLPVSAIIWQGSWWVVFLSSEALETMLSSWKPILQWWYVKRFSGQSWLLRISNFVELHWSQRSCNASQRLQSLHPYGNGQIQVTVCFSKQMSRTWSEGSVLFLVSLICTLRASDLIIWLMQECTLHFLICREACNFSLPVEVAFGQKPLCPLSKGDPCSMEMNRCLKISGFI